MEFCRSRPGGRACCCRSAVAGQHDSVERDLDRLQARALVTFRAGYKPTHFHCGLPPICRTGRGVRVRSRSSMFFREKGWHPPSPSLTRRIRARSRTRRAAGGIARRWSQVIFRQALRHGRLCSRNSWSDSRRGKWHLNPGAFGDQVQTLSERVQPAIDPRAIRVLFPFA